MERRMSYIYYLPNSNYVGQVWSNDPNRLQARWNEHARNGRDISGAEVIYSNRDTRDFVNCNEAIAITALGTHMSQGGQNITWGNGMCRNGACGWR
jgi:hypothetical protein